MAIMIGHSCSDENGDIVGATLGDQTGRELRLDDWVNPGWTYRIRAKTQEGRSNLAKYMKNACLNDFIGYSQNLRSTIYTYNGLVDPISISINCACDCSSLINYVCAVAGLCSWCGFSTSNAMDVLQASGNFETPSYIANITDATIQSSLLSGDILLKLSSSGNHMAIVVYDQAHYVPLAEEQKIRIQDAVYDVYANTSTKLHGDKLPENEVTGYPLKICAYVDGKVRYIRDVYYYNGLQLVHVGSSANNTSKVWVGWTKFESTYPHGSAQALSNRYWVERYPIKDSSLCYGMYQFHWRYDLLDFMTFCTTYSNRYAEFTAFLFPKWDERYVTYRDSIHQWFIQYANNYTEEFTMLQDKFYYDRYLAPGLAIAKAHNLPNLDDPYVKGTLGSMAVRDGAYTESNFGVAVRKMKESGYQSVLDMLKVGYASYNSAHPYDAGRWRWDAEQGLALQQDYANNANLYSIESNKTIGEIYDDLVISWNNVTFIGDERIATLGSSFAPSGKESLNYSLIQDDSISATWSTQVTDAVSFTNAYTAANNHRKIAIFWYGINDVQRRTNRDDADAFIEDYAKLIDEYVKYENNSTIYIVSILTTSTDDEYYYVGQDQNIIEYNKKIQTYCLTKGYHYLDIDGMFGTAYLEDTRHFKKSWYQQRFIIRIKNMIGYTET